MIHLEKIKKLSNENNNHSQTIGVITEEEYISFILKCIWLDEEFCKYFKGRYSLKNIDINQILFKSYSYNNIINILPVIINEGHYFFNLPFDTNYDNIISIIAKMIDMDIIVFSEYSRVPTNHLSKYLVESSDLNIFLYNKFNKDKDIDAFRVHLLERIYFRGTCHIPPPYYNFKFTKSVCHHYLRNGDHTIDQRNPRRDTEKILKKLESDSKYEALLVLLKKNMTSDGRKNNNLLKVKYSNKSIDSLYVSFKYLFNKCHNDITRCFFNNYLDHKNIEEYGKLIDKYPYFFIEEDIVKEEDKLLENIHIT